VLLHKGDRLTNLFLILSSDLGGGGVDHFHDNEVGQRNLKGGDGGFFKLVEKGGGRGFFAGEDEAKGELFTGVGDFEVPVAGE
jgi:hypothetical protein